MNNARRKDIARAIALIEAVKGQIEEITSIVSTAKDEEEEYRDNMPENLQGSERYEQADQAVSALEEAIGPLEDLDFDEVISQLETASE